MTDRYEESMRNVQAKEKELAEIKAKLQQLEEDFKKTQDYIVQLDTDKERCER